MLPGLGHLECRPVTSAIAPCEIPLEIPGDRLGVIIVKLDLDRREATLLGFYPTVIPGKLFPNQWQTINEFLSYIEKIEKPVRLGQWLKNVFPSDWYPPESILTQLRGRRLSTATNPARVKPINLAGQSVAILVQIQPTSTVEIDVRVRLYAVDESQCLPPDIQLIVADKSGVTLEAKARSADDWIQQEFGAVSGEKFTVTVALNTVSITEQFVVSS